MRNQVARFRAHLGISEVVLTLEDSQGGGAPEEQSMAALLEQETAAYPELRRGEIIEGTVVGNDRDGVQRLPWTISEPACQSGRWASRTALPGNDWAGTISHSPDSVRAPRPIRFGWTSMEPNNN